MQDKVLDIDTFQEELAAVGIKFCSNDFEFFLEFLSESGFLVKGNVHMVIFKYKRPPSYKLKYL